MRCNGEGRGAVGGDEKRITWLFNVILFICWVTLQNTDAATVTVASAAHNRFAHPTFYVHHETLTIKSLLFATHLFSFLLSLCCLFLGQTYFCTSFSLCLSLIQLPVCPTHKPVPILLPISVLSPSDGSPIYILTLRIARMCHLAEWKTISNNSQKYMPYPTLKMEATGSSEALVVCTKLHSATPPNTVTFTALRS